MSPTRSDRPPVSAQHRRLILPFPAWLENNPYLNQLYLAPRARGYDLKNATRLGPFYDHLNVTGPGDIVHVHWTAPIAQHAPDAADARARFTRFAARIRQARARGVRLIWTVHNKVPHDTPYPELEAEVGRFLAEQADLIVTINPATPELVADLYPLDPAKTVNLPHPSYQGLYPQTTTRDEARARLGLEPGAKGVLFFGQIRRYKGVGEFFDAMAALHRTDPRVVMLLAGKTSDEDRAWIEERLPASVPIVRDHRFIPDDEVQDWFAAADAVVLPFQRVLNSGSIFLCATFGRSVIVPRSPQLEAEFGEQDWLRYYDADDPVGGLAHSVGRALAEPDHGAAAALAFAAERPPYRMSRDFDDLLRTLE